MPTCSPRDKNIILTINNDLKILDMPDTDWESPSQRVGESMLSHATSAAEVRKQQRSEYASESRAGLDSYSEQERLSRWQKYMTKRPLPTYAERLKEIEDKVHEWKKLVAITRPAEFIEITFQPQVQKS